jgi:hypothetical protein
MRVSRPPLALNRRRSTGNKVCKFASVIAETVRSFVQTLTHAALECRSVGEVFGAVQFQVNSV